MKPTVVLKAVNNWEKIAVGHLLLVNEPLDNEAPWDLIGSGDPSIVNYLRKLEKNQEAICEAVKEVIWQ